MTITQASAVNIIWDYLNDRDSALGHKRTPDDVADAMRTLAQPAYKALGAGVRPDQITADEVLR